MAIPRIDWGKSGRVDAYELWLVDPFTLGELERVDFDASGSSITWAYYTDTKASATIEVLDDLAKDAMLRVKHSVNVGGVEYGETMGTFFAAAKGMDSEFGRVSRSMDCYSSLLRQQKDYLMQVHDYHPGDNVSSIIREIVEADGGRLALGHDAPTDRVHTQDMHWDVGTNKLEMVSKLAGWINGQIGVADTGEVLLERYVAPLDRQVEWTFEAGRNCVYVPGFSTAEDDGDVYNRSIFYYSTDEASGAAYAVLDPTHPYSYQRIGRNVTYCEQVNEEVSQDDLQYKATSYLQEHCGGAVYYEIEHAGVVGLRPGMVVRYLNSTDYTSDIDAWCMVTEMSVDSLSPMCMTKTKMRALA